MISQYIFWLWQRIRALARRPEPPVLSRQRFRLLDEPIEGIDPEILQLLDDDWTNAGGEG